jgi:hypothetical protein
MSLTTGQNETQRIAQRIYNNMDWGRKATSATTESLLVLTTVF